MIIDKTTKRFIIGACTVVIVGGLWHFGKVIIWINEAIHETSRVNQLSKAQSKMNLRRKCDEKYKEEIERLIARKNPPKWSKQEALSEVDFDKEVDLQRAAYELCLE